MSRFIAGTGEEDQDALPGGGSHQAIGDFGVCLPFGADKATKRQPVQAELGAFGFEQGDRPGWEANAEFFNRDFEQAASQEMTHLVDDDQAGNCQTNSNS